MGRVELSPSIFKLIAAGGRVLNTLAFKLVVEDLQDDDNKYPIKLPVVMFVSDSFIPVTNLSIMVPLA